MKEIDRTKALVHELVSFADHMTRRGSELIHLTEADIDMIQHRLADQLDDVSIFASLAALSRLLANMIAAVRPPMDPSALFSNFPSVAELAKHLKWFAEQGARVLPERDRIGMLSERIDKAMHGENMGVAITTLSIMLGMALEATLQRDCGQYKAGAKFEV